MVIATLALPLSLASTITLLPALVTQMPLADTRGECSSLQADPRNNRPITTYGVASNTSLLLDCLCQPATLLQKRQ